MNNFLIDLQKANKISQVRPIKILHVVSHMHRGGIETWLMNIYGGLMELIASKYYESTVLMMWFTVMSILLVVILL